MVWVGVRRIGCGIIILSALVAACYAAAESPGEQVRARLGQLDEWLSESNVLDQWRPILHLDQLQGELAKGPAADRATVMEVLGQFGGNDPGLSLEPFVRLRQALVDWLASLSPPPPDQLAAAARAAKAAFLPLTPTDLEDAEANLLQALDHLDTALQTPVPGERDWKAFLQPDKIREQLTRKGGPQLTVLDAAYLRFASGKEGLGRVPFVDVRNGLRRYLMVARAIGDRRLRKQYGILLNALATRLQEYLKRPSAELAAQIHLALDWLDQAQQAQWLVHWVGSELSHPNLFAEVSHRLIASRVAEPVDETGPVRDCILGTDIHATGHTVGNLKVELVPSADQGEFDMVFQGDTHLDSVGYHGPAQIFANAITRIGARKRIFLNKERIATVPAESSADTNSTINCVSTNRACLQKFATRRAEAMRPEADCIASRHAEQRFNAQIDERAAKLVADANRRYGDKFRRPLLQRRLFPELLRFSTSKRALDVVAMTVARGSLAAPAAPPAGEPGDLSVQLHQSAINNLAGAALGGMTLDEKRVHELLVQSGAVPKGAVEPEDEENWAITFARREPVTVLFGNDTFTVTIRGQAYASRGNQYPGMNVTARYKIVRSGPTLKAVRQGKLVVVPPGFGPGRGRQLSAREQVIRTVLQRRMDKFFGPEFVPKNLVLALEGRTPLELELSHWKTDNGWLLLAWKQVASSKPAVPPTQLPARPQRPT